LEKLGNFMPGGTARIWIVRDIGTKLPDLYKRQLSACSKLEGAETKLIMGAVKRRKTDEQKYDKLEAQNGKSKSPKNEKAMAALRQDLVRDFDPEKAGSASDQLVDRKDRPQHKINKKFGFLPFTGQKTDTIEWCEQELVTVTDQLREERSQLGNRPPSSSAFIRFHTQIAAHVFQQSVAHHLPLRMAGRYIEVASEDVIWDNLGMNPFQQRLRFIASWAVSIGLLIAWTFPVAFVGLLSNVNQLCLKYSWIRWLCRLPAPLNGIIQG
jgi:hypothetical protein